MIHGNHFGGQKVAGHKKNPTQTSMANGQGRFVQQQVMSPQCQQQVVAPHTEREKNERRCFFSHFEFDVK